MEITPAQKDILDISDIRQSEKWFEFLKLYGWKKAQVKDDYKLAYLTTLFGTLAKLQRPAVLKPEDLQLIEEAAKSNKALFIKIEPRLNQELEIFNEGYKVSKGFMAPPSTLYIDLRRKENDIWESFSHSAKYSINRASREGYFVEKFENPSKEKLNDFFKIIKETQNRKRFSTISFDKLVKQTEIFAEECFLFFVYDKNKNLMGGKYFLGYKNNVWYMYGATSNIGRKNKAGYKLVWESFLSLKRHDFNFLDFEGVDDDRFSYTSQWGGFSHFKEKFGGIRVEYPLPRIKYFSKVLEKLSSYTQFNI